MSGGRLSRLADRALAWFVTGPAGRLTAFLIDFAAYLLGWLRGAVARRLGRG